MKLIVQFIDFLVLAVFFIQTLKELCRTKTDE